MYPTKKEILAHSPPKISILTTEVILDWKSDYLKNWKEKSAEQKIDALEILITAIALTEYKKCPSIKKANKDCYSPKREIIYLNQNKPSIISALHELSHFLFGPSELTACSWSICIFRTFFPTLYKQLKWKGHLLIKK